MNANLTPAERLRRNVTALSGTQSAFICPSDGLQQPTAFMPPSATGGLGGDLTPTNHFGVVGAPFFDPVANKRGFHRHWQNNFIPPSRALKHCVDGTAQSLFAVERTSFVGFGSESADLAIFYALTTIDGLESVSN